MGAQLVAKVYAKWQPYLSPRAMVVLIKMSLTALDEDSETTRRNQYFAGRADLLSAICQTRGGKPESAERTLKRALAELYGRNAIKKTNQAYHGKNQRYELTLDAPINLDWKDPHSRRKG